jgi:molybdopterin-guanine dinucleotide biosynthesis protein A
MMMKQPVLSIAIQAGGESRRIGRDKALIPFHGVPLVQRIVERLAPLADELFVTTNNPQAYGFLDAPLIPDIWPGMGALGGLYTALNTATLPLVAVVACDMPFVSPKLLAFQRDILLGSAVDAVIPSSENGLEPLHAVYRRQTCLPAVESALRQGQKRLIDWHPSVNVRLLSTAETKAHDPEGLAFININSPEDLLQAEKLVRD